MSENWHLLSSVSPSSRIVIGYNQFWVVEGNRIYYYSPFLSSPDPVHLPHGVKVVTGAPYMVGAMFLILINGSPHLFHHKHLVCHEIYPINEQKKDASTDMPIVFVSTSCCKDFCPEEVHIPSLNEKVFLYRYPHTNVVMSAFLGTVVRVDNVIKTIEVANYRLRGVLHFSDQEKISLVCAADKKISLAGNNYTFLVEDGVIHTFNGRGGINAKGKNIAIVGEYGVYYRCEEREAIIQPPMKAGRAKWVIPATSHLPGFPEVTVHHVYLIDTSGYIWCATIYENQLTSNMGIESIRVSSVHLPFSLGC